MSVGIARELGICAHLDCLEIPVFGICSRRVRALRYHGGDLGLLSLNVPILLQVNKAGI